MRDDPSKHAGSDDIIPESAAVVVVGGGPSGCAAGVFLARYGLETVIFDRGTASLDRCAFLANYPGFPAGIDIETFYDLIHDHAREAGSTIVPTLVETVTTSSEDDIGFVVETQNGHAIQTEQVVAATRYDGEYLRPLGGDDMFETLEHEGETHEHFDPAYSDADGRTPIDGLYVASPGGQRDVQAIIAAGRGAHVARTLLEDRRMDVGYPRELAREYDWLRPESEFTGAWSDRDRWRDWFDARVPDDHDVQDGRVDDLREAYIDRAFETRRSPEEIDELTQHAHRRLLEHLDDDLVLERAAALEDEQTGPSEEP